MQVCKWYIMSNSLSLQTWEVFFSSSISCCCSSSAMLNFWRRRTGYERDISKRDIRVEYHAPGKKLRVRVYRGMVFVEKYYWWTRGTNQTFWLGKLTVRYNIDRNIIFESRVIEPRFFIGIIYDTWGFRGLICRNSGVKKHVFIYPITINNQCSSRGQCSLVNNFYPYLSKGVHYTSYTWCMKRQNCS